MTYFETEKAQRGPRSSRSQTPTPQRGLAHPSHDGGVIRRAALLSSASSPSAPPSVPTLSANDVIYLQRAAGNRAVAQLLQSTRSSAPNVVSTHTGSNIVQRDPDDEKPTVYKNENLIGQKPPTQYKGENLSGQGVSSKYQPQGTKTKYKNQHLLDQIPPTPNTLQSGAPNVKGQNKGGAGAFFTKMFTGIKGGIGSMLPSWPTKYNQIHVDKNYSGEDIDSLHFAMDSIFDTNTLDQALQAFGPGGVKNKLLEKGWSEKDVQKLMNKKSTKVKYLKDKNKRDQYRLNIAGTIKQGMNQQPWDTSEMFANGVGKGNGIFVMDPNGTFYGGQHKIGLFHHSSFMAGGGVAVAGTMQVINGKLQLLTNKTGHYKANKEQLRLAVSELKDKGVSPGSYAVSAMHPNGKLQSVGTGQDLLNQQG